MKALLVLGAAALVLAVPASRAGKPSFTFQATTPGSVKAGAPVVVLRVRSSRPARLTVMLYRAGRRLETWRRTVAPGQVRLRLALTPTSRQAGRYSLLVSATAGSETVFRTLRVRMT